MVLKQLKYKDLPALKKQWHEDQNYECPLFGKKYSLEDVVVDHRHKLKSELPDESGKGICRGVIHFQGNAIEGKITNAFKRYGGDKHITLIDFLRNLADYLEKNRSDDEVKYIHPSEEPKQPKLMKSSYNKLVRAVAGKQKVPRYTGKYTKPLRKLYEKYGIEPVFQSRVSGESHSRKR